MGTESNRVERGLYVCGGRELVANTDLNAAENMGVAVTPNPGVDRSNGWPSHQSTCSIQRRGESPHKSRWENHNIPTQRCGAVGGGQGPAVQRRELSKVKWLGIDDQSGDRDPELAMLESDGNARNS